MASGDLYRRNPARDVEQYAIKVVRHWLADRGHLIDTSAGHDVDFRIEYFDGRNGVGEVGWHQDPVLQPMWSKVFTYDRHQIVELPDSLGKWTLTVLPGSSIKRLYAELPEFVERLATEAAFDLSLSEDWPRSPSADAARRLGIEHIVKVEDGNPSFAVFFIHGIGGIVPTDPECITVWIDDVLVDPNYRDTTSKLLALDADERHVFFMTGDLTPFGADERLRRLPDGLPQRPPKVPLGISHLWAACRFGESPTALWVAEKGWSTIDLPPGT